MSCLLGDNRDIFFPKLSEKLHLITFDEIARRHLRYLGYEPYECESEDEARASLDLLVKNKQWPCFFSASNTTGEKDFEEFFTQGQTLDLQRFTNMGVIKNSLDYDGARLDWFTQEIGKLKQQGSWSKDEIVKLFTVMVPEFEHMETGKYLDGKM